MDLCGPMSFESINGKRYVLTYSQLHESAGGLPSLKLLLHSCSLAGSTNAMGIETSIALVLPGREMNEHKFRFGDGRLHLSCVGEQICKFGKPQGEYLQISL
ncbi:hypothetical protein Tco_0629575 [Tanacetum coccineum]|uniref:Uncharacterized protein n=1 Tax=Tanacetum coccineum TaxID=301880 RepID=A0ABQ4WTR9_9ASTR